MPSRITSPVRRRIRGRRSRRRSVSLLNSRSRPARSGPSVSGRQGMADLLVDTDVFVDHLRGAREFRFGGDSVYYSTISRCELFAGPEHQEPAVVKLLAPFRSLAVDSRVAEVGGTIRRETGILTPDALIAATAIVHGLSLLTRNRRDFDRVPRLRLTAP